MVTFGLSILIQNSLLEVFTADSQRLNAGALEVASIQLGDTLAVGVLPLLNLVTAGLVLGGLQLFFYRTALGRALRATADDPEIASLMGIDVKQIYAVAMSLAMAVVAIAGVFLAVRTSFDPSSGPIRLLYAFEAVIIGGLGNLWPTLLGGVILGVAQTVGAQINPSWQILSGHLVFLAILLVRPQGLFPRNKL